MRVEKVRIELKELFGEALKARGGDFFVEDRGK